MGPNPISFVEIEAWSRLTGRRPTPEDVRLIKMLDAKWAQIQAADPDEYPMTSEGKVDNEAVADKWRAFAGA